MMKTRKYVTMAALVAGVLALAGCGNNSTNSSTSTNSVSGNVPSTNSDMIHENGISGVTNAPPTNHMNQ